MIIIGAGIAGAMARGFFSSSHPQVYESKKNSESSHKAIMRFRDFSIGYLLGVPLEKIRVTKAIFYHGSFAEPNPAMLNMYSRKVSQGLFYRSAEQIEPVERFIAKQDFVVPSARYGKKLIKIEPGRCYFSDGEVVDYDVCISTIPMPAMARASGIIFDEAKVKVFPISVARYPVKIASEVYQTVYFPDSSLTTYRASLEKQTLIVEAQGEKSPDLHQEKDILAAFGLEIGDLEKPAITVQKMGKIVEMDEMLRKRIIAELTDKFNIYSLGRYAIWKNITSDVLLKDLEVISKLVSLSDFSKKYTIRLEEAKNK